MHELAESSGMLHSMVLKRIAELEERERAFEAKVKSVEVEQQRVFSEKMKEVEERELAFDAKVKAHDQQLLDNAESVADLVKLSLRGTTFETRKSNS